MFQLRLFDDKQEKEGKVVDIITISCINCNKGTALYLRNSTIEEMITKLVLNTILYHCSKKLHLQSYLEMIWSKTGCFGLLGNNIILVIILLDLIER